MHDPYEILGLESVCNDSQVRRAYLDRIKEFPPEQLPEQFRIINEAYELVKTKNLRIQFSFLDKDPGVESPIETLRQPQMLKSLRQPPSLPAMQEYLKQCMKSR